MSCDAVAFAAMIWLASTAPTPSPASAPAVSQAPHSVASEPLFADIVGRARQLKAQTDAFGKANLEGDLSDLPGYSAFKASLAELSVLDMQGHVLLASRGTDGDLKCILKGISQDLSVKVKDLDEATTAKGRAQAFSQLSYLLRDNVEVITSPPAPAA
jgi:hypothetical protein